LGSKELYNAQECLEKQPALAGGFMQSAAKTLDEIAVATDYGSWWWFIFITVIFAGLWYAINSAVDVAEISRNWPKYRCTPAVMPFASVYGHDTAENFNFCLQKIFNGQVGGVTGPFATIISSIIKSMMTFLQNINSLRVMLATLVGGVTKLFQEVVDRIRLVLAQVKVAGLRIQNLMRRVFATFYAVIYMGLSTITVGANFSDTFIFKFLDTFCFAPETPINIKGKGSIQISEVKLGDVCENGSVVTSVYRFSADGQETVWLKNIQVSTNHLVLYMGTWIPAEKHPDARPAGPWIGGNTRPFVCLDTDTHRIPIGDYIFSDWDETHDSDEATMILAEHKLNGEVTPALRPWMYQPAVEDTAELCMKDGSVKAAKNIQLGDQLSTGKVVGLGLRSINEVCLTEQGTLVSPSTLLWSQTKWVRAGTILDSLYAKVPRTMHTFVVLGGSIELSTGEVVRDMLEVHDPSMEEPTTSKMGPRHLKNPRTTQQDAQTRVWE
jgi:hypothetical protein